MLNFRVQRKTLNNACRAELGCFPPIITLAALKEGSRLASMRVCECVCVFLLAYLLHIEIKNHHSTSKVRTFVLAFLRVKTWF